MSQLNVTTLKHEASATDNITLDSAGNTVVSGALTVPSLVLPSGGSFAIKDSSNVDTYIGIDYAGRVTMPYQPAFDVSYSGSEYTAAGTVVFDTTWLNVGAHYSSSTGRFTAPVSGSYLFYTTFIKNADTNNVGRRRFEKNDSAFGGGSGRHLRLDVGQAYGDNGVLQAIIYLNAGDYVSVNQFAGSSYGTNEYDYFGGYLIG